MSLADAYESIDDSRSGKCKTCLWYSGLPPEDKEFFDKKVVEALETRSWSRLIKACKHSGLEIVPSSFRSHAIDHHHKIAGVR